MAGVILAALRARAQHGYSQLQTLRQVTDTSVDQKKVALTKPDHKMQAIQNLYESASRLEDAVSIMNHVITLLNDNHVSMNKKKQ